MSKALDQYLKKHSTPEEEVLNDLNRFTHLNVIHPQMLSGQILGGFLKMISQMINPLYILEVGTYTGYSAICLAAGLKKGGKLITIEVNDETAEIASSYFKKAGIEDRVNLMVGDAQEIIPGLKEKFDLVFIDANKEHYTDYYDAIIEKVNSGGFIIADNVLWGGKVLDASSSDASTRSIQQFNKHITEDKRVENFMLPIRDGIMLIKKT